VQALCFQKALHIHTISYQTTVNYQMLMKHLCIRVSTFYLLTYHIQQENNDVTVNQHLSKLAIFYQIKMNQLLCKLEYGQGKDGKAVGKLSQKPYM
jgi:hypothetical protein